MRHVRHDVHGIEMGERNIVHGIEDRRVPLFFSPCSVALPRCLEDEDG